MKNPMVLFVGAAVMAVAAVAVLAGVAVERWDDRSPPGQSTRADAEFAPDKAQEIEQAEKAQADDVLTPAVVTAPIGNPAAAPQPLAAAPAAVAVAEKIAPAEKIETAKLPAAAPAAAPAVSTTDRLAAVDPAAPEPEPAPAGPRFDVVRMEDDGLLLAVGRAAPGSEVALILDGEVIATMPTDDAGEWLIMPDQPLAPGSHELTVEASDASGAGANPGQVVVLDVPEREGLGPSIEPDATEESTASQALDPNEKAAEPEPVIEAEAPPSDADEELVALAPLPETDETEDPQAETPADALEVPLTLDSVDYNKDGEIVFSGRAQPGLTVSVYVDNRFLGETTVGLDGRWVFTGSESITPGRHTLRADLSDPTGTLSARIILPFVRADSRDVAALVESRREAADLQQAPESSPPPAVPETATAPEPAEADAPPEVPVVAEEVTPEPEALAVAESAAPEPKLGSEARGVAEPAAPDPEPKATAVAKPVVPEPETEVAEPTAPEAAPEAPEATAPVAPEPEPEPETPVMAAPVDAAPEVATAQDEALRAIELKAAPLGPGHVVIQPGNNLWRISRVIYGRGIEYTVIYQANRDRIRDPDLIYPGQIFATPGVRPPEEIDPGWREPLSPEDVARQDTAE